MNKNEYKVIHQILMAINENKNVEVICKDKNQIKSTIKTLVNNTSIIIFDILINIKDCFKFKTYNDLTIELRLPSKTKGLTTDFLIIDETEYLNK